MSLFEKGSAHGCLDFVYFQHSRCLVCFGWDKKIGGIIADVFTSSSPRVLLLVDVTDALEHLVEDGARYEAVFHAAGDEVVRELRDLVVTLCCS